MKSPGRTKSANPVMLEVFKNRFTSVAEEMGSTLIRTAFSTNIKERRDCSCAVFDRSGDMISHAAHIPVHLGSMPLSVLTAIEQVKLLPGDMVMVNNPFQGGTHLPDITLVAPVFSTGDDTPCFIVANRAHHADIGGMSAGSMPLSSSIFQEGIIIPPLKIVERGEINRQLLDFILANVRTPREREGDFTAQIMANLKGIERLGEIIDTYGLETAQQYAHALMDYSERIMRSFIAGIPDGDYAMRDCIEDDGMGTADIAIEAAVQIRGDAAAIDFTASDPQVPGCVNAVRSITLSCTAYVFRCLISEDIPLNAGFLRPLRVETKPGSILDARFPAAVAGGNVETSQRIVDVLLGALSEALPDRIPAASQGTMNNITIGAASAGGAKEFVYYETIGGGMGASSSGPGESAVHSHMTNTRNTPIEALEYSCPFLVREYSIRTNSGGAGTFAGGSGICRELELLSDAEVTVLSERRTTAPYGLAGGAPGQKGRNAVVHKGSVQSMPAKFYRLLEKGDRVRIETPGGGGYGAPECGRDG